MNLRAACKAISAIPGAPDAIRWGSRLRRAGVVPCDGLNPHDIARLLVAVAAAPDPRDAPRVLGRVVEVTKVNFDDETIALAEWISPMIAAGLRLGEDLTGILAVELFCRQAGADARRQPFDAFIAHGGHAVRLVRIFDGRESMTDRGHWPADSLVGCAHINADVLNGLAGAMSGESSRRYNPAPVQSLMMH